MCDVPLDLVITEAADISREILDRIDGAARDRPPSGVAGSGRACGSRRRRRACGSRSGGAPPSARADSRRGSHLFAIETAVREGAPFRQILRVAAEDHADLIVMGVQGRLAIDLAMFGSNSARVTRGATCATLVVPVATPVNARRSDVDRAVSVGPAS